ncbi:MAG: DUF1961 family protein, partial [Planctomycetes bacterium]|nr:DUF1961 family protein [Planctomycetota bacterium]
MNPSNCWKIEDCHKRKIMNPFNWIMLAFCTIFFSIAIASTSAAEPDLPDGLRAGKLLYETSMESPKSVKDWRMEGPGKTSFKDGWMHMQSPGEKMHHVFWCPKRFPESFIAQWQAQNLETDAGLCIVFFAAAGLDGQSILSEKLPDRNGNFKQYTRGAIRCYHTSYYANAAHNPDREQTNLRKNPGFHLVGKGPEGIPTESKKIHTITLAKDENHIRLWVDDKKVIDWTDTGKKGGKPHGDGFIGLRQMKWTHFRYRNFRVWSPRSETTSSSDKEPGATRAFPGAEGFGAYARGGRGGRVIQVTNLKDYNPRKEKPIPGSLRAACETKSPRTIVFRVAGWIDLKAPLRITEPFCTVAGQTAPGDGIGLRGDTFGVGAHTGSARDLNAPVHDVIVRYLRVRCGPGRRQGHAPDAFAINHAHDVIIDHCSISWGVDECLSITAHPWKDEDGKPLALKDRPRGDTHNITVQWSIISEGLYNSTHPKGHHSRGLMCTYGSSRVSIHHNLMAHNNHRNPNLPWQLAGPDNPYIVDVVNNVAYNWRSRGALTKHSAERNPGYRQKGHINFVGNRYLMGPDSRKIHSLEVRNKALVWAKDNIGPVRTNPKMDQFACVRGNYREAERRFETPRIEVDPTDEVVHAVLAGAGAIRPEFSLP